MLYGAAINGHAAVVGLLLEHRADPNGGGGAFGYTALHEAAKQGYAEICTLLIDAGADIDRTAALGYTALHLAASAGRETACDALIALGARTDMKARNATPAGLARRRGFAALGQRIDAMVQSRRATAAVEEVLSLGLGLGPAPSGAPESRRIQSQPGQEHAR